MKELSIEEKAKAYDEAIKRLEDIKTGKCQKTFMFTEGLFDYIFPELKESGDERIRKALIRFHKSTIDVDGIKGDDVLAWLEKQGKNNMGISEATKQKIEDNLNKALEKETPESCSEFLEKQGGQKPNPCDGCVNRKGCINCENGELREVEQKPTVEMKTPEESLGIDSDTYNKIVDECIYGEQNTAWSEEDINMIDWLIRCCEKEHEELCNDRYGHQEIVSDLKRDCRKKWDWLESLKNRVAPQKQWKPSDEQIDALEDAIADAVSSIQKNMLNSLYDDLKKLKE